MGQAVARKHRRRRSRSASIPEGGGLGRGQRSLEAHFEDVPAFGGRHEAVAGTAAPGDAGEAAEGGRPCLFRRWTCRRGRYAGRERDGGVDVRDAENLRAEGRGRSGVGGPLHPDNADASAVAGARRQQHCVARHRSGPAVGGRWPLREENMARGECELEEGIPRRHEVCESNPGPPLLLVRREVEVKGHACAVRAAYGCRDCRHVLMPRDVARHAPRSCIRVR